MLFVVNLLYQRFGAIFMSIHQFVNLFCLNYQAYSPTLLVGKLSYLVVSTILINFIPIIKSDGYYAFKTLLNQYNYDKTKIKGYLEDTVRGILMFLFLNILAYL